MQAPYSPKILFAALLVTTLSAPALAEGNSTAPIQQVTALGQATVEASSTQAKPAVEPAAASVVVVNEAFATETKARLNPSRPKVTEASPPKAFAPSASYFRSTPILVGVGY